jgi:hypothetical protein
MLWLFVIISDPVLRPTERMGYPACGQPLPTAQVHRPVCAAAATQEISWQDRRATQMVLVSETSMRAASLKKSSEKPPLLPLTDESRRAEYHRPAALPSTPGRWAMSGVMTLQFWRALTTELAC